jgi:hypothetical protein
MNDDFTARKFAWLDRVHADHRISALGFSVAYVIARHINRKSGEAWPTQETIARQIPAPTGQGCLSVRAVQKQIATLMAAELLSVTPGTGKTSSVYKLLDDETAKAGANSGSPLTTRRGEQPFVSGANDGSSLGRTAVRGRGEQPFVHNPLNESFDGTPLKEPIEERSPSARAASRGAEPTAAEKPKSTEWNSPSTSSTIEPIKESKEAFRNAEAKSAAKPANAPPAGKFAKLQREPVQVDMLAEDGDRQRRETMIAFVKAYPPSPNTPINGAGWKKVVPSMRKALAIAPAAEIIAGTERYAASGPTPDRIYGPRRFLDEEMFRRPWPIEKPRTYGRQNAHDGMAEQRARLEANLASLQSGEGAGTFDPSNPFGLEGVK